MAYCPPDTMMTQNETGTVYEALNEARRELYVGWTPLAMHELSLTFSQRPPKPVSHWRPSELVTFRSVEFELTRRQADDFISKYAAYAGGDWRVFSEAKAADAR